MKQETLNIIANIDENTIILPKSEGGVYEMYQLDSIADLRKASRNFMRTEKILESIDAKTSAASELVAGIVTEARIKEISKSMLDDLKKNIFENMHPIGSIYTTTSAGFDPNTVFGGLWERYAQGRTLIGVSDSDATFSNVGLTGGAKTKTLALTNLPAHSHTASFAGTAVGNHTHTVDNHTHLVPDHEHQVFLSSWAESGSTAGHMASGGNTREFEPLVMDGYAQGGSVWTQGSQPGTSGSGAFKPAGSVTVTSTGQGREFDILNPYITVYFWKRVG